MTLTTPLTADDLKAIRHRANAASDGPWYARMTDDAACMGACYVSRAPGPFAHDQRLGMAQGEGAPRQVVAITLLQYPELACTDDQKWDENTEFIAHARTDIPRLLAHIDHLTQQLQSLRGEAT